MEMHTYDVRVTVVYPPNTDTEGYAEELRTMPEQTRAISEVAGLWRPEDVAAAAVDDIVNGNAGVPTCDTHTYTLCSMYIRDGRMDVGRGVRRRGAGAECMACPATSVLGRRIAPDWTGVPCALCTHHPTHGHRPSRCTQGQK
jgi:hypothetical protein